MREFELALKAAADPTRTRILKLLEGGGLCGCQVQAVLGIAPSTVSKHLSILRNAGLVTARREGKWIEYALVSAGGRGIAGPLVAMLRGPLDRDPAVIADRKRLRRVNAIPRADLCVALPRRTATPAPPRRLRRTGKGRAHA